MKLVMGTNGGRLCLLCNRASKEAGVCTGKRVMLVCGVLSMVHSIVCILCIDDSLSVIIIYVSARLSTAFNYLFGFNSFRNSCALPTMWLLLLLSFICRYLCVVSTARSCVVNSSQS